jgi:hypothetical protein
MRDGRRQPAAHSRATTRERAGGAALLRRTPSRPGRRAARRERAQPAQQFHQAGRPGRPVRPSPAAAGVPAVAQGAFASAAAAVPRGVLRQGRGGVACDAGDCAGGGAQARSVGSKRSAPACAAGSAAAAQARSGAAIRRPASTTRAAASGSRKQAGTAARASESRGAYPTRPYHLSDLWRFDTRAGLWRQLAPSPATALPGARRGRCSR